MEQSTKERPYYGRPKPTTSTLERGPKDPVKLEKGWKRYEIKIVRIGEELTLSLPPTPNIKEKEKEREKG